MSPTDRLKSIFERAGRDLGIQPQPASHFVSCGRTRPIDKCQRCGLAHPEGIQIEKLTFPTEASTHWGPCPTIGQPILMKVRSF